MIKTKEIVVGNKFIRKDLTVTSVENDKVVVITAIENNSCDITFKMRHVKSGSITSFQICTGSTQKITDFFDEYVEPRSIEPRPRLSFIE